MKREAAVTKEMSRQLNDDKKISRKEKDERILWKKNEVFNVLLNIKGCMRRALFDCQFSPRK